MKSHALLLVLALTPLLAFAPPSPAVGEPTASSATGTPGAGAAPVNLDPHDREVRKIYEAWRFDPKDAARPKQLGMGGMNSSKAELTALPFWLGPTGITAEVDRGAMTYTVTAVEEGAPAHGKIRPGDIIVGVRGQKFGLVEQPRGDDPLPEFLGPNPAMGNAILDAWDRHDGKLQLDVTRNGESVSVELRLPGAGRFGDNFPERDPLADAWILMGAELLASRQYPDGSFDRGQPNAKRGDLLATCWCALALMATGESRYDAAIRKAAHWVAEQQPGGFHSWIAGYQAIFLGEYHLRTGDRQVLARLKQTADELAEGQFHYNGSGHSSYTGNYRGSGITICTNHALLGMVYACLCGVDDHDDCLRLTMEHVERISPEGGVPYTIWGRREIRDDDSQSTSRGRPPANKRNEHAGRSGSAAVAFGLTDANPSHFERIGHFLAANSDWMDNGHCSGNTISWLWGCVGLWMTDEDEFARHMKRRQWWLVLKRRHDGGVMLQPAECINFRSGDGAMGNHSDLAAQIIVLAAPRRMLRMTGAELSRKELTNRKELRTRGTVGRLRSLADWNRHFYRGFQMRVARELVEKRATQRKLDSLIEAWAGLDVDAREGWLEKAEALQRRYLPAACRAAIDDADDDQRAADLAQMLTGIRVDTDLIVNGQRANIEIKASDIPYGDIAVKVDVEEPRESYSATATSKDPFQRDLKVGRRFGFAAPEPDDDGVIRVPVTVSVQWEGVTFTMRRVLVHGVEVPNHGKTPGQPLVRVPATVVGWGNEGMKADVDGAGIMTYSVNAMGVVEANGTWRQMERAERAEAYPPGTKVWLYVYHKHFNAPFLHRVEKRR